jgi:hypothetical protein
MTKRESFIATLIVAFSALLGVGIVEVGYHIYQRAFPPLCNPKQRTVFFDGLEQPAKVQALKCHSNRVWPPTSRQDTETVPIQEGGVVLR